MRHYGYCNRRVPFDYGNKAAVVLRGRLHPRSGSEGVFDVISYWSGDSASTQFEIFANGTVSWHNDDLDGGTPPYRDTFEAIAVVGGSTAISTNSYAGRGNDYEWRVGALINTLDPQVDPSGFKWKAPKASSSAYMVVGTIFGVDDLEISQFLMQVRRKGTTQVLDTFQFYMKAESF